MYVDGTKKLLPLFILEVLRKYTDEEHRLTQKQIVELIEKDFEIKIDRKTLKRNLEHLIDAGYAILYAQKGRESANGPESLATDFYIEHDFASSELRLLIDSVLFSQHIPEHQRKSLLRKIRALGNQYFKDHVRHVHSLTDGKAGNKYGNKQLFYTIEVLDCAIAKACKVKFNYGQYDVDGRLHSKLLPAPAEQGVIAKAIAKEYTIDPYQLVATNGHYYLIGYDADQEQIIHYRIDRILNIELTEQRRLPLKGEQQLDLPKYLAEHLYMFSGDPSSVRFRIDRSIISQLFDWFGTNLRFENITEQTTEVVLKVNEKAMLHWALQFSDSIEILKPATLRQKICETHRQGLKKYS